MPAAMDTAEVRPGLSPRHRMQLIHDSGIPAEIVERESLWSATAEEVKQLLGWDVGSGGIVFPYPGYDDFVRETEKAATRNLMRGEVASMQHAELINSIIRYLECKPDLLVRVPCVYCHNGKTMILDPTTGQYRCQACGKYGKLSDLAVLATDIFEHRHRYSIELMETDGVIRRRRR